MKLGASRILSILFLFTLFSGSISADRYYGVENNNCARTCYECSCHPLYCGAFDLQLHAGIAPVKWRDRGNFGGIVCAALATPAEISASFFQLPKFGTLYKLPWTVGGQLGYAISDNIRLFLEINYLQAQRKHDVALASQVSLFFGEPTSFTLNLQKYRLVDAYLGASYYFDRWCDFASVFIGAKAGLTHHHRINFSSTVVSTDPGAAPALSLTTDLAFFQRNTAPSGGLHLGIDFCFCGNWSLALTGEVVASCGLKGNRIAYGQPAAGCGGPAIQPALPIVIEGLENLMIGHIGMELRFPITASVRYSF